MKFYLAGRFIRSGEINECADELRGIGHTVSCRWLLGNHQIHPGSSEVDASGDNVPMIARPFAQDDIEDVEKADALVLFTERPYSDKGRGGRHVEFGYALGKGKEVYIIGPRENVFHTLPGVKQYASFDRFLKSL